MASLVMSPKSNRKRQPSKPQKLWIEGLQTIGMSLLLAFGVRTFAAQAYFIPSGSMEPTLQIDDKIMVDKVSYRFKLPQRGDIVVFQPPERVIAECGAPNTHDAWIKRVIGLPGDKVEVKGRRVLVNNHSLSESYIAQKPAYQWGPAIVPQGSYLVFGDNRNNSCDGHTWGFLPQNRLIGHAFIRYWPLNRVGALK
jgi:signal peptidase I